MGTLYENIMLLCSERGIKGGKMCSDTGISKGLLSDLKMGRRTGVSAVTAQKIADYFGVTVGYLLGTDTEDNTIVFLTNKQQERLLATFENAIEIKSESKGSAATEGQVIIQAKAPSNFFARLRSGHLTAASLQDISRIAKILEVSDEIGTIIRSSEHDTLDDVDVAFYGDFKTLSEDQKETIRDMVRVMRERRAKQEK